MKNQPLNPENNNSNKPFTDPEIVKREDGEQENVFDDDNSRGKNALGENPEQILYNNPEDVEDASQIVSDGND